jgi:hypothetical protein
MIETRVLVESPLYMGQPARLEAHTLTDGHVVEHVFYRGSSRNLDRTISLTIELVIRTVQPPPVGR